MRGSKAVTYSGKRVQDDVGLSDYSLKTELPLSDTEGVLKIYLVCKVEKELRIRCTSFITIRSTPTAASIINPSKHFTLILSCTAMPQFKIFLASRKRLFPLST